MCHLFYPYLFSQGDFNEGEGGEGRDLYSGSERVIRTGYFTVPVLSAL